MIVYSYKEYDANGTLIDSHYGLRALCISRIKANAGARALDRDTEIQIKLITGPRMVRSNRKWVIYG